MLDVWFMTDKTYGQRVQCEKGDIIQPRVMDKRYGYKFVGWVENGKVVDFSLPIENSMSLKQKWSKIKAKDTKVIDNVIYNLYDKEGYVVTGLEDKKGENVVMVDSIEFKGENYPVIAVFEKAFHENANITNVRLSENLVCISENSFGYCKQLQKIDLPRSLNEIRQFGFRDCMGITSLFIPNNIKKLGEGAFFKCGSVETLEMEEGCKFTGGFIDLIGGAWALKTLKLPSSIGRISSGAFSHAVIEELIIPEGIVAIGQGAFEENKNLVKVTLPKSVHTISKSAFYNCKKLTDINLGNVEKIGQFGFCGCENLSNVNLENVKEIEDRTFASTKVVLK